MINLSINIPAEGFDFESLEIFHLSAQTLQEFTNLCGLLRRIGFIPVSECIIFQNQIYQQWGRIKDPRYAIVDEESLAKSYPDIYQEWQDEETKRIRHEIKTERKYW